MSVIVPARNASQTLASTLGGLAQQRFAFPHEIVVVDDGSSDDTAAIAAQSGSVRVVDAGGVGPGRARNVGAAAARAELLAFIDADCTPTPEWLAVGVEALGDADLVQGATRPDPREEVGPYDRTLSVTRPHGLYESANLFVRRSLFDQLGGFESWLGPRDGKELGEDAWFGWRARRAGAHVDFCSAALVHHAVFARGPLEFVAERRRLRFFPPLARRIPELRAELFYRRYFLSRRSAALDAALAALLVASASRRRTPLLAAIPYFTMVADEARRYGPRRAPEVAAVKAAADLVGFVALARGSVAARTPLL